MTDTPQDDGKITGLNSINTSETAMRASTEDWCERSPAEGHSWSYTMHAGEPLVETRTCMICRYVSVQPVRAQIVAIAADLERSRNEQARLRQRATALDKLGSDLAAELVEVRRQYDTLTGAMNRVANELELGGIAKAVAASKIRVALVGGARER